MEENQNKSWWGGKLFFLVFVLVLSVVGGAVYYLWPTSVDPGVALLENYERAMRADTYGGATPEETLRLFVEALKAEDVELAGKYFLLDENGSREKWVNRLNELKEKKLLAQMGEDLIKIEADAESRLYENDYNFVILGPDKTVLAEINMELNKYSGVWKIESF